MNAQLYILFIIFFFLYIFFKHAYLLKYRLLKVLKEKHAVEWKHMMEDTGWLTPNWSSLYKTKAFHDFVWYSNEDYGDNEIMVLRKKLKRIVLELTFAFIFVIVVTILLINIQVLH